MTNSPESTNADDEGISPVVGTILMVGIVVVLSAAVMFFVTGFAVNDTAGYASVDIQEKGLGLQLQLVDTDSSVNVKVNGDTVREWDETDIGATRQLQCLREGDTVAIATESDGGSEQVVQTYTVEETSSCEFEISQGGGDSTTVTPINWNSTSESASDFYSYEDNAAFIDGITSPNMSSMFFYLYDDSLSLIIVHDTPDRDGMPNYTDSGGGYVEFNFHNLPDGEWALQDDGHPGQDFRAYGCEPDDMTRACWMWQGENTDGGVYAGNFQNNVDFTIENAWGEDDVSATAYESKLICGAHPDGTCAIADADEYGGQIDEWNFLSRSGPGEDVVEHPLNMGENVTIRDTR